MGKLYSRLQTENELTISRIRIYLLIPQQPQRTLTFPLRAGRESASKGRKKKHITGRRMERLIFFSLAAPVVVLGCGEGGVFYRKIINRYVSTESGGAAPRFASAFLLRRSLRRGSRPPPPRRPGAGRGRFGAKVAPKLCEVERNAPPAAAQLPPPLPARSSGGGGPEGRSIVCRGDGGRAPLRRAPSAPPQRRGARGAGRAAASSPPKFRDRRLLMMYG